MALSYSAPVVDWHVECKEIENMCISKPQKILIELEGVNGSEICLL